MKNTLTYSFIACFFLAGGLIAQNGPGGIKSTGVTQVWLDAQQISSASPGGSISQWNDISGNGNNFNQGATQRMPTYQSGGLNSKNYVEFYDDFLTSGAIPSFDSDRITWIYAGNFNSSTSYYQTVINQKYSVDGLEYLTYYNNVYSTVYDVTYDPNYRALGTTFSTNGEVHLVNRNANRFESWTNGQIRSATSSLSTTPSGHQQVRLGARAGSSPTWYFNGRLYEVIMFNENVNSAEINIVTNYLCSKYALTPFLDLYTHDASHGENLIGIGQESDGSNLVATGQGIVTLQNPDDLQDGEYLMLGDDAVSLANTSLDVPAGEPAGTVRFQRVWRIGENQGDVGTIEIILDVSTYRPGTDPSTIKICVDSDNGVFADNGIATAGIYSAVDETVTFSINLSDGDYISFCGSEGDIESTGVTSDWSLVTTWNCGCIPSLSDSVTILNGHLVNVDDPAAIARTIYIQPSGELDFTGGYLTIEENIISDGTFNISNGTLDLNGPSAGQTIQLASSATIDNLDISAANGATLVGGPFIVNGTFTMNGNIDNSSATFILNSDASGDGRIAMVPGSVNFSDDITVRRFIPAGPADYRNVSPPHNNWSLSQWDDELIISGNGFPDGCALQSGQCFYSAKTWDGSDWDDFENISSTILVGTGIHIFMGDDLTNLGAVTLESNGNIFRGNTSIVGYTGWNIMGNVYPSAIDFESLRAVSFRMDDYYYVYDPASASYDWYDGSGGTGGLDQYISRGQAFWVAPPTGATQPTVANFNELVKTSQTATWKAFNSTPSLYLKISSTRNNWGNKIAFNTHPDAKVGLDTIDIPHLVTPEEFAPYIATKNEYDDMMTVTYFPDDEVTVTYPILVNTPFMDYYTISAQNLENFNQYSCVYLLDLKTNEEINLREEGSYTFFVDQTKSDETRFLLVCSNDGSCNAVNDETLSTLSSEMEEGHVKVQQMNNFFNVTFAYNTGERSKIEVLNTLGQVVYDSGEFNMSKGTKTVNLENGTSGVYFIRVTHGTEVTTKKVFVAR